MITFYPFMHQKESKKDKDSQLIPLYLEIEEAPLLDLIEEPEISTVEIIEIL